MKPISPEHCVIELRIEHPSFGQLVIDTFQRHYDDCERIKDKGQILYQSNLFPVLGTIRIDQPPGWGFKASYFFLIPWDYLYGEKITLRQALEEAKNYIDNFATAYEEGEAHGSIITRLEAIIRNART